MIGHVLFEVLDLVDHKAGAAAEVRCLARKGTTPAKSKLAKRGSGVLVHLCKKAGCRSPPATLKGGEWLHFGSWRPVSPKQIQTPWMKGEAVKRWLAKRKDDKKKKDNVEKQKANKTEKEKAKNKKHTREDDDDDDDDDEEDEDGDESPQKNQRRKRRIPLRSWTS